MNVFELRGKLVDDYATYIKSFLKIRDPKIKDKVSDELKAGRLWPNPLIQLNPCFKPGATVDELVAGGVLHEECSRIFRRKYDDGTSQPLRLHTHQETAIGRGVGGKNYVLTTGTGSGKSLTYIIPIVDHVLKNGSGKGIKAIVVYPMNALANSQMNELKKFICAGYPEDQQPVTFERYTGQEDRQRRTEIIANPPDILLTNYVMLELLMTRPEERQLIDAAKGLQFVVLDELHTYRGRQGSDVSMLLRRVRNYLGSETLQCVGTSATLAAGGSFTEQRKEVADVAATLFGSDVEPNDIIGETLTPITGETDFSSADVRQNMRECILSGGLPDGISFADLSSHPFAAWIEAHFGIEYVDGRLTRVTPKSIETSSVAGSQGAATVLANMLSLEPGKCAKAIEQSLNAGYQCLNPDTGFPSFAFRLHQFISRGDTVYASVEAPQQRYLTLNGQKYVPGEEKTKRLYPLLFCRECGEAYYSVLQRQNERTGTTEYIDTPPYAPAGDEDGEPGYLYLNMERPWPETEEEMIPLVPDDWREIHRDHQRIKPSRRKDLPQRVPLAPNGTLDNNGVIAHFLSRPFRFCLNCGATYSARQKSDFSKLATLGTEGRSTATTILSLYTVRALGESSLPKEAQKLLSFTDNRQDASLQSGHFNDFVEVGLLRAAMYRAVEDAGPDGLQHDVLTQKIFGSLNLPFEHYAQNPEEQYSQRR
ncbi:MAG: DEAD/DEAH box helicase, partial [Verrucomicrobia bacterium]|nr:DEAD/DEAH box helicase [Verrucomicrobiota bacterium]